ncbi:hypothetical protein [Desulfovibrio inopinatus]|uniref:hypothetical protein n=1 Tax=Desulfovibrio inopinatus TaxID=102109 RepID=UPI00041E92F4|nr:hypothetical protein [Desulfovibrio inopinatus]
MRTVISRPSFLARSHSFLLVCVMIFTMLASPLTVSAQTISGKGDAFMDFYSKFMRELKEQRTHLKSLRSKYQQVNDITLLQAADQLIEINQEIIQLAETIQDLFFLWILCNCQNPNAKRFIYERMIDLRTYSSKQLERIQDVEESLIRYGFQNILIFDDVKRLQGKVQTLIRAIDINNSNFR